VRIGDELRITATVASKEDEKKHVTLDCEIKNQNGAVVLSGLATVIAPTEKVRRPRTQLPPLYMPSRHQYTSPLSSVASLPAVRCAVVHPCDAASLRGALEAGHKGLIVPVLIGPQQKIQAVAAEAGLSLQDVELLDVLQPCCRSTRRATGRQRRSGNADEGQPAHG
jgi:phosphate acetyltransferase